MSSSKVMNLIDVEMILKLGASFNFPFGGLSPPQNEAMKNELLHSLKIIFYQISKKKKKKKK